MRTVKGAVLVMLGIFMILMWVLSVLVSARASREQHVEEVRRYGPWGLLAYCVLLVLSSGRERALSFSPAEVNFLFSGPFPRRHLLTYKVIGAFAVSLFTATILAVAFRKHALSVTAAYIGLVLSLLLLQLFAMAVVLVGTSLGARFQSGKRSLLMFFVIAVVAFVFVQTMHGSDQGLFARVEQSTAARMIAEPFRWFVNAFTAQRLWPDLALWGGLALAVDAFLLMVIFSLEDYYLETAAAAGARLHARLTRLRAGMPAAAIGGLTARRVRLPNFPWLAGVGPLAWRQLLTAGRQVGTVLTVLIVMLAIALGPALAAGDAPTRVDMGAVLSSSVVVTAFFLPMLLPFDFRGDVDRIDLLKALPLPAWSVVAGELFAPVAIMSLVQWTALIALQLLMRRANVFLLAAMPFVLPVNWLIFAMENFVFLWFPARTAMASPGDFQAMGRQVVISFGRLAGLFFVALVVGPIGGLVYYLVYLATGPAWQPAVAAALATAWLCLMAMAVGTMPALAHAFRRFDVALDTPP